MYMAFLPRYGSVSGQTMLKNTWSIWPTISYNIAVKSSGMGWVSICIDLHHDFWGPRFEKHFRTFASALASAFGSLGCEHDGDVSTIMMSWSLSSGIRPTDECWTTARNFFLDNEGLTRILRTLVDVLLPAGQRAGNQAGIFLLWPIYTCRCGNFCVCIWDPLVGRSRIWSGKGTLVASNK